MSITKESAYLYVYSKALKRINKKLQRASKQLEKTTNKHNGAKTIEEQLSIKIKHTELVDEIKK